MSVQDFASFGDQPDGDRRPDPDTDPSRRIPQFVRWLQPRHTAAAARTLTVLSTVAGSVTIAFAMLGLLESVSDWATVGLTVAVAGAVVVTSWLTRYLAAEHTVAWAVLPFLGILLIVGFDLATADASVGAQIFFLFPALYGAAQLHPPGARVLTAAALAGQFLVVFSLLPARDAVTDAGYVAAALITTTALLNRSAERQDVLIAKLHEQAAIDPLTGLVTRRVLDQAAGSALSGAGNDAGTALIVVDIDNFKEINDRYGHPGGDDVLVQLAALLNRNSRSTDIIARLGGDEIALLLPGCTAADLLGRAEGIIAGVREHPFALADGREIHLSVSAGLAHAPTHATELRALYNTADAALYAAKRAGRDQVAAPPHVPR